MGYAVYVIVPISILLIVITVILIYHCLTLQNVDSMFDHPLTTPCTDFQFHAISLPKRKSSHFDPLAKRLKTFSMDLHFQEGINGKDLDLNHLPSSHTLAPRYINFFKKNKLERENGLTKTDYRGHLGCTLSHLSIISQFAQSASDTRLVILEDDADPISNFREQFVSLVSLMDQLDPLWDVLILGCSAKYEDHGYHKENDSEPIYGDGIATYGIAKLHYWIGGWAYVIRNPSVAQKIMGFFQPISWHIDIVLAEETRGKRLKTYATLPPIVRHPGRLRISSWDMFQLGDVSKIKTDTNG